MSNAVNLQAGQQYKVVKLFTDFDGIVHSVGETWTYVGTNFLPYDDGLTLHVTMEGRAVIYRLQWRPEEQEEIIENFARYVEKC